MSNLMELGVPVLNWTPQPEKYMNDNIHPVVRYIEEGFAGHQWWMVTTPYPGSDSRVENPILYWGDSEEDGTPPLTWHGGVVVEEAPGYDAEPVDESGYNSDASIFYDKNTKKLWVFWRVNHGTYLKQNYPWAGARATFAKSTIDGINFSDKKLICPLGWNTTPGFDYPGKTGDAEMSPIVLARNDNIYLYGVNYRYNPNIPYGLAKWSLVNNDLENDIFTNVVSIGQKFKDGFDFWHVDFCDDGNGLYFSVVTPQNGKEILIGISNDGDNFRYYDTPLLDQETTNALYLYKASCLVKDGIFYLWYPNRRGDNGEISHARIFMSQIAVETLLTNIENTIAIIKK